MKLAKFSVLLATIIFYFTSCGKHVSMRGMEMPQGEEKIRYQPISPIEWRLANGLTVVFQEDAELPIVRGNLFIRGGALWEFEGKVGLVSAMGNQMRQGGAGALNADQLDRKLEMLAAGVGSEYGGEYGSFSFSGLSSDFEEVFSIFSDVLLSPRFDQDRIDLWKGQMIESIRRRTDDPSTIASLSYRELVLGPTPFGRVLVDSDIKRISRLDFLRAHRRYVRPNGAYLVIVGKVKRNQVEELVNKYLAGWEPRNQDLGPAPEFNYVGNPGIYFIKEPFAQSTVYIGHSGPKRLEPDHIASEAFNSIFGEEGFGSRLMRKIRTDLGLVYGIYGGIQPGFQVGQVMIGLQTKAESTGQSISESFKVLQGLQKEVPTDEELEQAKKSIQNSFIFRLDTPDDAAKRHVLIRLLGYPEDYDATFVPRVLALSKEEIREVAKNKWDPKKFAIVVVGNDVALESLKDSLAQSPEQFYNLKLNVCDFKQRLESCVPY